MTPGRCCRAIRTAVFAAACVLLAALGHLLMSGTPVPWWAMASTFVATAVPAWFLARRERGVLAVTSLVVVAQAAMHTGFSLAQAAVHPAVTDTASFGRQWAQFLLCGAAGTGAVSPSGAATGAGLGSNPYQQLSGTTDMAVPEQTQHVHDGMRAMTDHSAALMPNGHDMGGMSPAGMLAAHLLAALLCGVWLAYGEQGAFRLLRAFAGWIVAPLRLLLRLPTPSHRPRVRPRRCQRARVLRQLLLAYAIASRGPPSGTAVV